MSSPMRSGVRGVKPPLSCHRRGSFIRLERIKGKQGRRAADEAVIDIGSLVEAGEASWRSA
jgi:hypothetical protein